MSFTFSSHSTPCLSSHSLLRTIPLLPVELLSVFVAASQCVFHLHNPLLFSFSLLSCHIYFFFSPRPFLFLSLLLPAPPFPRRLPARLPTKHSWLTLTHKLYGNITADRRRERPLLPLFSLLSFRGLHSPLSLAFPSSFVSLHVQYPIFFLCRDSPLRISFPSSAALLHVFVSVPVNLKLMPC